MLEEVPTTAAGAAGLRALLAAPERALIGLDFDGTLAPIVADPDQARPAPGAPVVLRRLAARVGTLAVVTGRPATVAAGLLDLSGIAFTNVVVLGHYGLERWTPAAGVVRLGGVDASGVDDVRSALPSLLRRLGAPAGTTLEDKGASIAVHVRRTADPTGALALLRAPLESLARAHGLRLEPGRMVWELRTVGIDKGLALEALVHERGATAVCYAGDDLGDLAAFDALDRLRVAGLTAVSICSGSGEVPELEARADIVVGGPADLVLLLDEISDAVERASQER